MRNCVFFSKHRKDVYSPKLLELMRNLPNAREFAYVCIDADPVTRKRNEQLIEILEITEVPTIYIRGNKLQGLEAFEWITNELDNMADHSRQPHQQARQQASQQPPLG